MLRNFSWIVPDRLAGMAWPGEGALLSTAAAQLRGNGIGLVVTLTRRPIEAERVKAAGMQWLHLPVHDYAAPSRAQLVSFVTAVDAAHADGQAAVAHCAAGVGRTGTCLAAYLVHLGADPTAAVHEVRTARPGSIESLPQERAVIDFGATP